MIINRELRKSWDFNTNQECMQMVVSYVDKDGTIKFLTYNVPESEMFEWDYSKFDKNSVQGFMSWDMKPVRKVKAKKALSKERFYQILFDLNINGTINPIFENNIPTTYFWDIETDISDDGFPEAAIADMPITVMSWVHYPYVTVLGTKSLSKEEIEQTQHDINEHCKKFDNSPNYIFNYVYYQNETALLADFTINYLAKVPAVSGWNIWGFDWLYFYNRCEKLGIDLKQICPTGTFMTMKNDNGEIIKLPKHKLIYDYLACYKKWDRTVQPKESNKLDFVGDATCGVKKVQHKLSLKEMWEQQPREYIYYNAIDSILVEQIDKKIKTSSSMYGLASLTKAEVNEVFGTIASVEIVQNEYLYKERKVLPISTPKVSKREYEGAFVFKPNASVSKWVLGLDFASLYPSSIRQFNLSPETYLFKNKAHTRKTNEIKTFSGSVFTKDVEGFMPRLLTHFYGERKRHKKQMGIATDIANELQQIYNERLNKQ